MFIEKIRHEITLKAAFLTFMMIVLATIIRPFIIEQSILFTYIGIFNSLAMGSVFIYLKYTKPKSWHPIFLTCIGLLILMPIIFVSGSINSQFAFLFPSVPIFVALVSNARNTWVTGIIIVILVIGLFLSMEGRPDFTYENVPLSKTTSRAFWLCLAVLLTTTLGVQFNRIYGTLGDTISEQAETDLLTGLKNRRSVMSYLQMSIDKTITENSRLSIMMIDLDHFKTINDTYGHLAGDKCLIQVARLIRQNIRDTSDLAGRFGGEEFIVIIKDIDPPKANDIAHNIRRSIEHATVSLYNKKEIKLTATIGICTLSGDQLNSIEQLIDLADKALYRGKNQGRNRVSIA